MLRYLRWKGKGFLWELFRNLGVDVMAIAGLDPYIPLLHAYDEEFDFLRSLPDAIDSENFTFVHAGRYPNKPLEEHSQDELNRIDRFMDRGTALRNGPWWATTPWCSTARIRSAQIPS